MKKTIMSAVLTSAMLNTAAYAADVVVSIPNESPVIIQDDPLVVDTQITELFERQNAIRQARAWIVLGDGKTVQNNEGIDINIIPLVVTVGENDAVISFSPVSSLPITGNGSPHQLVIQCLTEVQSDGNRIAILNSKTTTFAIAPDQITNVNNVTLYLTRTNGTLVLDNTDGVFYDGQDLEVTMSDGSKVTATVQNDMTLDFSSVSPGNMPVQVHTNDVDNLYLGNLNVGSSFAIEAETSANLVASTGGVQFSVGYLSTDAIYSGVTATLPAIGTYMPTYDFYAPISADTYSLEFMVNGAPVSYPFEIIIGTGATMNGITGATNHTVVTNGTTVSFSVDLSSLYSTLSPGDSLPSVQWYLRKGGVGL